MMNRIYDVSILYCLIFSMILFALPVESFSQKDLPLAPRASSNSANNLRIDLLTDKTSFSIGDEIHFKVIFSNQGNSPFRILIDTVFIGSNFECIDIRGKRYSYDGGYNTWSPKAGVFTGRTHLLKANEKMSIKMDAFIFNNYQLIFSNMFDRKGSNDYQELKKRIHLPPDFPDKYISAGRIFPLLKPNRYRFTYVYEATEADKRWRTFTTAQTPQEAAVDLLWIGKAASNTIEILIQ